MGWLTGPLFDGSVGWSIVQWADWLVHCLMYQLADPLFGGLVGWFIFGFRGV